MQADSDASFTTGIPGLTELGKRIEMLRIERGLSKQQLARRAGTSRQQLWRVVTGKSELTPALRTRLAEVLNVPPLELEGGAVPTRSIATSGLAKRVGSALADYLSSASSVTRTLATMPTGDQGRLVKRAYLDALEDAALASGQPLDSHFFDLRRRVLAGEL
jgi:transcriptional regulator with XRE-family HTH domain